MRLLNGWLCQIKNKSIKPIFADIEIKDGKITDIVKKNFSGKYFIKEKTNEEINLNGRVVTIPNVNYHDHIYSRLAKGLNISGDLSNFPNILKNLWWKLDYLLDVDMIRSSATFAAFESIKHGVTYIIDHHSSPNAAKGSLEVISNELMKFGIRNVLCFETTDRNGKELTKKGIEENINFFENSINDNVKSLFGLHASFTLDDDTLSTVSRYVNDNNLGTHTHLCEDVSDNDLSMKKYGASAIDRLLKYDLVNDYSIVAHGIHLSEADFNKLKSTGASLVLNLDSNMNNSVGLQNFKNFPSDLSILLGTDGMHANIARSIKELFLLTRHFGFSFEESFNLIIKIYFDQIDFIKKYFPDFPSLKIGDRADLVVWDYIPPTPLNSDNFWGHFIYGIVESNINNVISSGKLQYTDNKIININESKLNKEIYKYGNKLFAKFNEE